MRDLDLYEVRHLGPAEPKPEYGSPPIAEPAERITAIIEALFAREPQLTRELVIELRGADTATLAKLFGEQE